MGATRSLEVTGNDVTVQDLMFMNGFADDNGGNVFISGDGKHRLINSTFSGGFADSHGGNVHIDTDGTVIVESSTFLDGTAGEDDGSSGGGLSVVGASGVTIIESTFIGNIAPEGGGFSSRARDAKSKGQVISIENSVFQANAASYGGAFVVVELGVSPSLFVLDSLFEDNTADSAGAISSIDSFLENTELVLENNQGSGNVGVACSGFRAFQSASVSDPICIEVNENFPR